MIFVGVRVCVCCCRFCFSAYEMLMMGCVYAFVVAAAIVVVLIVLPMRFIMGTYVASYERVNGSVC